MMWLVMLAKVFPRTVEASFHRGDAGVESFGNFGMAPAFLNQREQRAILRPQLRERMTQGVELFGIHRTRRLRDILMLFAEWQKNPAKFLPTQLIDARIAREPEQPRLELRRRLQPIECPDHLDEHLLRQIFDVITSAGHGINEASDPMLVADNELPLGGFVALLGSPHEVGQRSR
jgi:hypothetical protein